MSFDLSPEANKKLEEIIARYPQRQSAAMPAIYLVQEECGYIPDEALAWVASKVGLTPIHVKELVTFYTMYRREPLGSIIFKFAARFLAPPVARNPYSIT